MEDQDAINEQEWALPENWSRFGVYRSARDMRLWVPKKNQEGPSSTARD
jgi:hypothetical protein